MGQISNDDIEKVYELAKGTYNETVERKEALNMLSYKYGMNRNSAADYIRAYYCFIEGKCFHRTINKNGIDYYLKKICEENGIKGLEKALKSLDQHIKYYEKIRKTSLKKSREIYNKYSNMLKLNEKDEICLNEIDEEYKEGWMKRVLINRYGRNKEARQKCIKHYGTYCYICGFSFEKVYGNIGKDFIHIHHIIDIATIGSEYSVDPIKDLIPVCPNCHSMLHRRKPSYSIDELKAIIKNKANE